MKLSKKQVEVVEHLKATSRALQRWPGGFWTTEQVPASPSPKPPQWWCGTQTVRALERVGAITAKETKRDWWKQHYVLTDAGGGSGRIRADDVVLMDGFRLSDGGKV